MQTIYIFLRSRRHVKIDLSEVLKYNFLSIPTKRFLKIYPSNKILLFWNFTSTNNAKIQKEIRKYVTGLLIMCIFMEKTYVRKRNLIWYYGSNILYLITVQLHTLDYLDCPPLFMFSDLIFASHLMVLLFFFNFLYCFSASLILILPLSLIHI